MSATYAADSSRRSLANACRKRVRKGEIGLCHNNSLELGIKWHIFLLNYLLREDNLVLLPSVSLLDYLLDKHLHGVRGIMSGLKTSRV